MKKSILAKTNRPDESFESSAYGYSNIMQQKIYREWLHDVDFTAPYALTLTVSRIALATQNQFANLKRISIR